MNEYDLADRLEELYIGTHIQKAAETIRLQADKLKKYELRNQEQRERIAYLEAQVYGGVTK